MREHHTVQPMRIQARPGSKAEQAYVTAALPGRAWPMPKAIAPGVNPAPLEDLIFHGGKTVAQMEFQNVFLGADSTWAAADVAAVDAAILRAMQHNALNNVMAQYFRGKSLSCDSRKFIFFDDPALAQLGEPDVQRLATALYDTGAVAKSNLDSCIFNLILPPRAILSLGNSSSVDGLGGYHGSVHIQRDGKDVTIYYSANVFSQRLPDGRENGIDAFDAPWKNVVATLYHELNEFRTDADVNDAIAHRENDLLGWNSRSGREVGDQPIFSAGLDLQKVFKEIDDPPRQRIPVQFLYSNAVHGAEGPIPQPHS